MTIPAYQVKSGDRINGIYVYDGLRRCFGGFYVQLVNGERIKLKNQDCLIVIG